MKAGYNFFEYRVHTSIYAFCSSLHLVFFLQWHLVFYHVQNTSLCILYCGVLSNNTPENEKGTNHSCDDLSLKAGVSLQFSNNLVKDLMAINERCALIGIL